MAGLVLDFTRHRTERGWRTPNGQVEMPGLRPKLQVSEDCSPCSDCKMQSFRGSSLFSWSRSLTCLKFQVTIEPNNLLHANPGQVPATVTGV